MVWSIPLLPFRRPKVISLLHFFVEELDIPAVYEVIRMGLDLEVKELRFVSFIMSSSSLFCINCYHSQAVVTYSATDYKADGDHMDIGAVSLRAGLSRLLSIVLPGQYTCSNA